MAEHPKASSATDPPKRKPTIRMEMPGTMSLPTVGDTVTCTFKGTVCRIEQGKEQYGDGKVHSTVEIEHDPDSVAIRNSRKRTLRELEEEDARI